MYAFLLHNYGGFIFMGITALTSYAVVSLLKAQVARAQAEDKRDAEARMREQLESTGTTPQGPVPVRTTTVHRAVRMASHAAALRYKPVYVGRLRTAHRRTHGRNCGKRV